MEQWDLNVKIKDRLIGIFIESLLQEMQEIHSGCINSFNPYSILEVINTITNIIITKIRL